MGDLNFRLGSIFTWLDFDFCDSHGKICRNESVSQSILEVFPDEIDRLVSSVLNLVNYTKNVNIAMNII